MSEKKISLYDLEYPALEALLTSWGTPKYRTRQVWKWLYVHKATSYNQMANLPRALRDQLSTKTDIGTLKIIDTLQSSGREARKDLLLLADSESIETVLMRYERRRTACISTQVGCTVGCEFCATGQMGFRRNLSVGEITAQVVHFARILQDEGDRLTNVVFMGMGEPLLNYDATLAAIRRVIDPQALGIGQRHITLSTVGIIPGIDRLAQEPGQQADSHLQITLAISLHAATNELRNRLVPMNRCYDLDTLFEACHRYADLTNRRISFEWALIEGLNDTQEQAEALVRRLSGLRAHVNLIPINPTREYRGRRPSQARVTVLTDVLDRHSIPYSVRLRRGIDIEAGCGQLKQRHDNS